MPTRQWTITLLNRTLDDGVFVAEPLLFPELCCCDSKRTRLRTTVRDLARQVLEQLPLIELHRRIVPSEAQAGQIEVVLDPPERRLDWIDPVHLRFDVVRWMHGSEACLAIVPALGIEVVARRPAELNALLPDHILTALRRNKTATSLFALALAQRDDAFSLERITFSVQHKTAKQIARDVDEEGESSRKLVICDVGTVLGETPLRPAFEIEAFFEQMAELLTGRFPRSVLLVGPSGVGKTSAVHELARRRALLALGHAPIWSTSGARLIAGMEGHGMWQQRCQRLCKEAARDGAILHLGNLLELMEVGRVGGSQGIAGLLKEPLSRGELVAIAECTAEQLAMIERQDPRILELFHVLRLQEPDAAATARILRHVADANGEVGSADTAGGAGTAVENRKPAVVLSDNALETLVALHSRYATYSAAPGRPVRFLVNLLKDRAAGDGADQMIGASDVVAAFSRETGLPLAMLDPRIALNRADARAWFAGRLIGQDQAIDLVIDLLTVVKAALTRPRRPIASLLFIGPTGVGKTEMAKALAEYFFGDRNRLTRLDMSEFAGPSSVQRLVGSSFGTEGLLTAKVREQPFSVLLFDEFEKAHGGFFDLLLQVLGDGRLTDAAGRLADFSNTIIIMTSNLGAASFGRGTFGLTQGGGFPDPQAHFTQEVQSFVRPELFNRIDRVVPFLPLDAGAIAKITDKELEAVRQRDGFKLRGLSMNVSPEARQHLSNIGYDMRYGARPLKRAIERQVLAPLAEALGRYPTDMQLEARATLLDGKLAMDVRARVDPSGKAASAAASASSAGMVADACALLRRDVQRLLSCPSMLSVTNLLFQLEREQKRKEAKAKAKTKPVFDEPRAQRMRDLRQLIADVGSVSDDVNSAENLALSAAFANATVGASSAGEALPALQARFDDLLLQFLSRQSSRPHRVLIGVFGAQPALLPLVSAYASVARACAYQVEFSWYDIHDRTSFRRHRVPDPSKLLDSAPAELVGIAMSISGPHARARLMPEAGVHVITRENKSWNCFVDGSEKSMADYIPPDRSAWPTEQVSPIPRRTYDMISCLAKDHALKKEFRWTGRSIEPAVADAIELQLRRAARAVIDP